MKGPLDIQNNGIHASSSAFEAMVERSIWFQQSLKSDPYFGKRLVSEGVPTKTLRDWSMNCIVHDSRLFDHMLELGAEDCIAKALELLKISNESNTVQLFPSNSVASAPQFPSIQNRAAFQSGSKSINRRLFERAMAQDYKEFASNESGGFTPFVLPDKHRLTHTGNSYQIQPHQNIERFQVTQHNMSYEKTTYSDQYRNSWKAEARDRYITETASIEDNECETNDVDQPATSSQLVKMQLKDNFQKKTDVPSGKTALKINNAKGDGRGNVVGPTLNHIAPTERNQRKVFEI